MGSAIAEGLLAAGRDVTVWNRTEEKTAPLSAKGATVVDSAADAIGASDLTIVVLPDAASTRELLLGPATAPALDGRTSDLSGMRRLPSSPSGSATCSSPLRWRTLRPRSPSSDSRAEHWSPPSPKYRARLR